ncbi:MAG: hypothetical protein U1B80_06210, partial [Anaerolineaceae bacterium]|nr:hypothetical protein [Anaerolineaceae bacterium]
MKKSLIIAGVFVGLFLAGYALAFFLPARPLTTFKRTRIALGTVVEIQVRSADEKRTEEAIRAAFDEVSRIEVLLSAQNPDSPVWKANHNPAQSVA